MDPIKRRLIAGVEIVIDGTMNGGSLDKIKRAIGEHDKKFSFVKAGHSSVRGFARETTASVTLKQLLYDRENSMNGIESHPPNRTGISEADIYCMRWLLTAVNNGGGALGRTVFRELLRVEKNKTTLLEAYAVIEAKADTLKVGSSSDARFINEYSVDIAKRIVETPSLTGLACIFQKMATYSLLAEDKGITTGDETNVNQLWTYVQRLHERKSGDVIVHSIHQKLGEFYGQQKAEGSWNVGEIVDDLELLLPETVRSAAEKTTKSQSALLHAAENGSKAQFEALQALTATSEFQQLPKKMQRKMKSLAFTAPPKGGGKGGGKNGGRKRRICKNGCGWGHGEGDCPLLEDRPPRVWLVREGNLQKWGGAKWANKRAEDDSADDGAAEERGGRPKPPPRCYNCGMLGHISKDGRACPLGPNDVCHNCLKPGHRSDKCPNGKVTTRQREAILAKAIAAKTQRAHIAETEEQTSDGQTAGFAAMHDGDQLASSFFAGTSDVHAELGSTTADGTEANGGGLMSKSFTAHPACYGYAIEIDGPGVARPAIETLYDGTEERAKWEGETCCAIIEADDNDVIVSGGAGGTSRVIFDPQGDSLVAPNGDEGLGIACIHTLKSMVKAIDTTSYVVLDVNGTYAYDDENVVYGDPTDLWSATDVCQSTVWEAATGNGPWRPDVYYPAEDRDLDSCGDTDGVYYDGQWFYDTIDGLTESPGDTNVSQTQKQVSEWRATRDLWDPGGAGRFTGVHCVPSFIDLGGGVIHALRQSVSMRALLDSGAQTVVGAGDGSGCGGEHYGKVHLSGVNSRPDSADLYRNVPVCFKVRKLDDKGKPYGPEYIEQKIAHWGVFSTKYKGDPLIPVSQGIDDWDLVFTAASPARGGCRASMRGSDQEHRVAIEVAKEERGFLIPVTIGSSETKKGAVVREVYAQKVTGSTLDGGATWQAKYCGTTEDDSKPAHQVQRDSKGVAVGWTHRVEAKVQRVTREEAQQIFLHRDQKQIDKAMSKVSSLKTRRSHRSQGFAVDAAKRAAGQKRHWQRKGRLSGGVQETDGRPFKVGEKQAFDYAGGKKSLPLNPWGYTWVGVHWEAAAGAVLAVNLKPGAAKTAGAIQFQQRLQAWLRAHGGATAGTLVTDNELQNAQWIEAMAALNLSMQRSPPRAQDFNPAERGVQQIFVDARAITAGARWPPFTYPFAIGYASAVGLLMPSPRDPNKSKWEILRGGKRIDARFLPPYAALCRVTYLPIMVGPDGKYASKLTLRTVNAYFVGWKTFEISPNCVFIRPVIRNGRLGIQVIHSVDFEYRGDPVNRVPAFDFIQRRLDKVRPRKVDASEDVYGLHEWPTGNIAPGSFPDDEPLAGADFVVGTIADAVTTIDTREDGFIFVDPKALTQDAEEELVRVVNETDVFEAATEAPRVERAPPPPEPPAAHAPGPPQDAGGGSTGSYQEGKTSADSQNTGTTSVGSQNTKTSADSQNTGTTSADSRNTGTSSTGSKNKGKKKPSKYSTTMGKSLRRSERRKTGEVKDGTWRAKLGWVTQKGFTFMKFLCLTTAIVTGRTPTFNEAMHGPHRDRWIAACQQELDDQAALGTYEWVEFEDVGGGLVIPMNWRLLIKVNAKGGITKYKARAYCGGNFQRLGEHYTETFAPCASMVTVRIVLALMALLDLEARHWDLKNAFCQAEMPEDEFIYCRPPPGVRAPRGRDGRPKVLLLKKGLYGLKQSALLLWRKMHAWFRNYGFVACLSDACLLVYRRGLHFVIIVTWVDDILAVSNSDALLDEVERKFFDENDGGFKGESLGEPTNFVGIGVRRDRPNRKVELTQTPLIDKVIDAANIDEATRGKDTPGVVPQDGMPGAREETHEEDKFRPPFKFRVVLGILLYIARVSRPGLMFVSAFLARYADDPSKAHYRMLHNAVLHLKRTKDIFLTYSKAKDTGVHLKVDADWGGCKDTLRATSGWAVMLGGAAVDWGSKRQSVVATSSMHAELIALFMGLSALIYVIKILAFLGVALPRPIDVYEDNQSVIAFMTNPANMSLKGRVKHFRLKLMWVREQVHDKLVQLLYIKSADNTADVLTKLLGRLKHSEHARRLLGLSEEIETMREGKEFDYKMQQANLELSAYINEVTYLVGEAGGGPWTPEEVNKVSARYCKQIQEMIEAGDAEIKAHLQVIEANLAHIIKA